MNNCCSMGAFCLHGLGDFHLRYSGNLNGNKAWGKGTWHETGYHCFCGDLKNLLPFRQFNDSVGKRMLL